MVLHEKFRKCSYHIGIIVNELVLFCRSWWLETIHRRKPDGAGKQWGLSVNLACRSRNGTAPQAALLFGLLMGSTSGPACADGAGTDELWKMQHAGGSYLTAGESTIGSLGAGQGLLVPPWGSAKRASSFTLSQPKGIQMNVGIDTGVYRSVGAQGVETRSAGYFLGISYSGLEGGIWYTNGDEFAGRRGKIEAGWTHAVDDELSFSLRIGHTEYTSDDRAPGVSSLSIGAQRRLGNIGFGLGVVEQGLVNGSQQSDRFHLFGNLSAAFR